MRVRDLMKPATTCDVNDTLNIAAMKMWDYDCGSLPVVRDDGRLSGMITDRDICMAAYTQGRPLDEIFVHAAMATHVVSARAEQPLDEVTHMMAARQVRRVPVVDADGKPIGIISLTDLAAKTPATIGPLVAAIGKPHTHKERM